MVMKMSTLFLVVYLDIIVSMDESGLFFENVGSFKWFNPWQLNADPGNRYEVTLEVPVKISSPASIERKILSYDNFRISRIKESKTYDDWCFQNASDNSTAVCMLLTQPKANCIARRKGETRFEIVTKASGIVTTRLLHFKMWLILTSARNRRDTHAETRKRT